MKCPNCGSEKLMKNGRYKNGAQQYVCKDCGKNFNENTALKPQPVMEKKSQIGMTLEQFRQKHDVDYIVERTLKTLVKDRVYEKTDVIKLTGLRSGYPGLSLALENATDYKGKAGGVNYWGHPDTIGQLKLEGTMT
jgi:DNA-directed RNA polymerase subunit RPC12/RpoP